MRIAVSRRARELHDLPGVVIVADLAGDPIALAREAAAADQVIFRLESAGILRALRDEPLSRNGRPPRRWQVNPALAEGPAGVAESAETPSDADADDVSATPSPALSH